MWHDTPGETRTPQRIVVGIDGSACSRAALRWAFGQARRSAGIVEVVTAAEAPEPAGRPRGHRPGLRNTAAAAGCRLADLVAEVRVQLGGPPVAVRTRIVRGDPGELLPAAAAGARFLVVGRGGNGAGLGSVSRRCVRDAPCCVIVIPAPAGRAG